MAISVLCGLLYLSGYSSGLQLKIEGQRNVRPRYELLQRGNMDGTAVLSNTADLDYSTNITLGGQVFKVQIDTGSSDLWVADNVRDSIDTGTTAEVTYAVGGVEARYIVHDQAFLQITPDNDHQIGTGILGLGPTTNSEVYRKLNTSVGYAALDRIFLQNTSTSNYLTVLLGRTQDPTDVFLGELSIGEILDGYSNVESEPKLQILIDEDGIIGPDGKSIPITTEVKETSNSKQATVVLDTGFSTTQVPKSVSDAIYSRFSGAEYRNLTDIGEVWIVPCDEEVNVTFKFSGNSYHVHPLDAIIDPSVSNSSRIVNSKGQTSCIGTFQPILFPNSNQTFDMILGMSFLRNVYAVFNYGDFVAGGNDITIRGDPYVQLLSTTDPAEAHSDFVAVRSRGFA
ncbi:aspartic peptidase domain-containing protein [Armillaria mellea]|nr:aspartic peptidase domain-containing protein [Armillaria mellea]